MDKLKIALVIYTLMIVVYVYFPISTIVVFSFTDKIRLGPPIEGLSLRWYQALMEDEFVQTAFWTSVQLGAITAAIVLPLSIGVVVTLMKPLKIRKHLIYYFLLCVLIPGPAYGLSVASMLNSYNLPASLLSGVIIDVSYTLPFAVLVMLATIDPLIPRYVEVAKSLGASSWKAFRRITFPLALTSVSAAIGFAFTLAYDEVLRSKYYVNPYTLPIYLASFYRRGPTPEIYAVGALTTVFTISLLVVVAVLLNYAMKKRGAKLLGI